MSDGMFLTWIRRNVNKKVCRYHIGIEDLKRELDTASLVKGFEQAGIKSPEFTERALQSFKIHYTAPYLRGDLAHRIFDPFMFIAKGEGYRMLRGGKIYRLEKNTFTGSRDLRHDLVNIGKYNIQLRGVKKGEGSYIHIETSEPVREEFRESIRKILKEKSSPDIKLQRSRSVISDFTQNIRYAKSDIEGIYSLKRWLLNNSSLKRLAYTNKSFMDLPDELFNQYMKKHTGNRMFFEKRNFFWSPQEVAEKQFRTYYSPYMER